MRSYRVTMHSLITHLGTSSLCNYPTTKIEMMKRHTALRRPCTESFSCHTSFSITSIRKSLLILHHAYTDTHGSVLIKIGIVRPALKKLTLHDIMMPITFVKACGIFFRYVKRSTARIHVYMYVCIHK